MPYLAMLDRLRAFFRGDVFKKAHDADKLEADAPRLIVCGYLFLDDHLNEALLSMALREGGRDGRPGKT
jgi:hypothetical protein